MDQGPLLVTKDDCDQVILLAMRIARVRAVLRGLQKIDPHSILTEGKAARNAGMCVLTEGELALLEQDWRNVMAGLTADEVREIANALAGVEA
jgi:hypothetical protein